VTYYDSPSFSESHFNLVLPHFLITSSTFIPFYDKTYELLEKNEELPIIVR